MKLSFHLQHTSGVGGGMNYRTRRKVDLWIILIDKVATFWSIQYLLFKWSNTGVSINCRSTLHTDSCVCVFVFTCAYKILSYVLKVFDLYTMFFVYWHIDHTPCFCLIISKIFLLLPTFLVDNLMCWYFLCVFVFFSSFWVMYVYTFYSGPS